MENVLTIDVEDYYMVSAFADTVRFDDWPGFESRVERNTQRLLELLAESDTSATFFVLGWIAEYYPNLVRDIHAAGHEIACHGYNHRLIYHLTPDEFREDTHRAKGALEELIGEPVIGYRATSYSIIKKTLWALDVLVEEGFRYDSSIFPILHDRYGIPGADRFCSVMKSNGHGELLEIPPSTISLLRRNFPIAGGGYLRLLPIWLTTWGIQQINNRELQPAVVYVHPWEIDHEQPRMRGALRSRFRHYVNLDTTTAKLRCLLERFSFRTLRDVFASDIAKIRSISESPRFSCTGDVKVRGDERGSA